MLFSPHFVFTNYRGQALRVSLIGIRNYYLRVFATATVHGRDDRPLFRKVHVHAFRIAQSERPVI